MFFLKKISSFFKYSSTNCNVKNCTNRHYNLLMCKSHYDTYISDSKIESIQEKVFKYNFNKTTFKEKLIYLLHYLIHYTTAIHVYYIEHFPLESIFLFHYKKVLNGKNQKFTRHQFINDFDFEENVELQYLKTKFNSPDAHKPLEKFIAEDDSINFPKFFMITSFFTIICYFILTTFLPEKFSISKLSFFTLLMFILSIYWYFNSKSLFNLKNIFQMAYENNLFKNKEDNDEFVTTSLPRINKINGKGELTSMQLGLINASILSTFGKMIYENWSNGVLQIFFTLIVGVFLLIIGINTHITSQYRILSHSSIIKLCKYKMQFSLYDLDKSAGITELKKFLRSSLLYLLTSLSIISFLILTTLNNKFTHEIYFILVILVSFLFFEIFNTINIIKLSNQIKIQFNEEINKELSILDKSKTNSKFQKAEFINDLKLNLFLDSRMWLKLLRNFAIFLITFLINKYHEEIIDFIRNIWIKLGYV